MPTILLPTVPGSPHGVSTFLSRLECVKASLVGLRMSDAARRCGEASTRSDGEVAGLHASAEAGPRVRPVTIVTLGGLDREGARRLGERLLLPNGTPPNVGTETRTEDRMSPMGPTVGGERGKPPPRPARAEEEETGTSEEWTTWEMNLPTAAAPCLLDGAARPPIWNASTLVRS